MFSRTRDFADAFAESLDMLDECILLEIYPAREKPIEGVSSQWLLDKMKLKNKKLLTKEQILQEIKLSRKEIIITMGAGDIDSLIEPIEKVLEN